MTDSSRKKYPKKFKVIFICAGLLFFYANALAAKELTPQQREARAYRAKGLEYQNAADLPAAAAFYQKAIALDPFYAVAYNDLGIIFESSGQIQQAKQLYLRATEIDPNFLSAYANLAIIYEQERDLEKAAYYWQRRAELGNPDDKWTIKAERRLADIRAVLSDNPDVDFREQETIKISKELEARKSLISHGNRKKGDKVLARETFNKAKKLYKQGKELDALKTAVDAKQLDPSNTEIEEFLDKLSSRILSR